MSAQVSVFPEIGTAAHARVVDGDKAVAGLAWIGAAERAARKAVPGMRGITLPVRSGESEYLWTAVAADRKGIPITTLTIVVRS